MTKSLKSREALQEKIWLWISILSFLALGVFPLVAILELGYLFSANNHLLRVVSFIGALIQLIALGVARKYWKIMPAIFLAAMCFLIMVYVFSGSDS